MPPRLVAVDDGTSILLDKPITLIGRHPECDVQLESSKVSRRHCCIAQVADRLVVRDLGSTNGIRVNGVQMAEGQLHPGDELTIGNIRYRLDWASAPEMNSPPNPGAGKPRRRVKKTTAIPGDPVAPNELESCDIPVPIKEPGLSEPLPPEPPKASQPEHQEAEPAHSSDIL